jgi:hypothetical protein
MGKGSRKVDFDGFGLVFSPPPCPIGSEIVFRIGRWFRQT